MENLQNKMNPVWQWIYRLHSVFLAIPVLLAALILALRNIIRLPQAVTFSWAALNDVGNLVFQNVTINKTLAVWGPFGITAICVSMIFLSRRVVYPWLISLFSLVLPLLIVGLVHTGITYCMYFSSLKELPGQKAACYFKSLYPCHIITPQSSISSYRYLRHSGNS